MITLTDTVQAMFTPAVAAALEDFLHVSRAVQAAGKPLDDWFIDTARGEIRSCLLFQSASLGDGPVCADITFRLPENALTAATLPEEHAKLCLMNGTVHTFGRLCMTDPDAFYLAETVLSIPAYQRIAARLRAENPDGWRTWQRWPDRDDRPSPSNKTRREWGHKPTSCRHDW